VVALLAVYLEQETGCLAQLLIAQWAIESKWGEKQVGHANFFGIKRAAGHTKSCTLATGEIFTAAQLEIWSRQHVDKPARVIEALLVSQRLNDAIRTRSHVQLGIYRRRGSPGANISLTAYSTFASTVASSLTKVYT